MYINFNIINFYFFKINALESESIFKIVFIKRGGLVTESISNEIYSEGCNEMKKVSSCHKDINKLSESQYKSKGLTRVNFCYNTGSTLPPRDSNKLRGCIFSFFYSEFKRKDFDLSIHTCTKKSLIFLHEFDYSTLGYITTKCGNLGKYCSLISTFLFTVI